MSADLLAEFGLPMSSGHDDLKQAHKSSDVAPQQTRALIPDFPDASSVVSPVLKGGGEPPEYLWHTDSNGADILFDASGDHYGLHVYDSEQEGAPAGSAIHSQSLLDLEGSIDPPQSSRGSESQNHEDDWGDFSTAISHEEPKQEELGLSAGASSHEKVPDVVENAEKEEWDTFEDGDPTAVTQYTNSPPGVTSPANNQAMLQPQSQPRGLPSTEKATAVPAVGESRPTNLPPPVILLQILPKVFECVADISNTEQSVQVCNAIIRAHTVASRLIAGRTLRWKRDNILSQSAKIGPAAAGRKGGGMKLAAIDKSESIKEEREVADVIQAWDRHAHFFNSTIHRAGIQRPLMTLSENFRPRTAKADEVLTSPHACALCGLKRDERIPEADINVDDSFGEFWIQHWGHRACKDFWNGNQALVPQR
jgi:hypothetical protein